MIESDNVILSKSSIFVGKEYSCDGMFKLSINEINKNSVYIVECDSFLWHSRVGHLNFGSLNFMSKNGYIVCKDKQVQKCEICIQ